MSKDLKQQSQRLSQWFQRQAIPFWREHSLVAKLGTSIERFDVTGGVDTAANVRVRVQARQAFFFTAAQSMGWCEDGAAIGARMLSFVETHAAHPSAGGGYTHLFNPQFEVLDQRQDLYDHAFFLLAYAWQYRVSKDASALAKAEALVAHFDARFYTDNGGWKEGDYEYSWRRQNPHMHLFEAFMALYEASGDEQWLARAGQMFELFKSVFFSADSGVLFEFFNEDWSLAPGADGQVVEPGHMFEWVWLLDWYQRLTGVEVDEYLQVLFHRGLELGYKADSGLVFDSVTPSGAVLQSSKRCWGLTELIKSCLVMARRGDSNAEALAARSVATLFDYYLCGTTPGTYVDQRGEHDEVIVDTAPASTLYHLLVLMQELQAYCDGER
ncbi:AGE family epimerase/isomerase [Gilvimarinus sp. SDUM040013]|uniref:AGE family epimerase/isomerase n=1 Tax=Gilvimarinus gilvus TaxID=3058038 RepID=A0ABU4RZ93_9GAMM|nr:AGE family epimerase/isomerase [Gilvimarinus sp. SDUM040013]MDO3387558.1 AGE family epimerase/isomerase [Gilvimarinus sp. SDUM040013]MDX6850177.1 AGE family epimerase/isomerase [Gilvimarinus sp. SDUM040013]